LKAGLKDVFDDMGGRFEARLRDHRVVTRTSKMREGEITLTSAIAVLEMKFDFQTLDRLHDPCFVAIERPTAGRMTYVLYEVVALRPTHFQMLGMDVAMPTVIRKEYLDTISMGWGKSDETWIDVVAVPTMYRMDLVDGDLGFSKARLTPLTGSKVHLLSKEAVQRFLCVKDGVAVGTLAGFNIPLTVHIESVVRYHTGVFGFTGTGKSNLTAMLVRKAVQSIPDLRVVIFDVAGEYAVHLIDVLPSMGVVFSTEDFQDSADRFLNAQTIPETLEARLSPGMLREAVERLFQANGVRSLTLAVPGQVPRFTLGHLMTTLERTAEEGWSGGIPARIALQELTAYLINERGYDLDMNVTGLKVEDRERFTAIIQKLVQSISQRSSLRLDLESLINHLEASAQLPEPKVGEAVQEQSRMNPERLAEYVLDDWSAGLNIVYVPELDQARQMVSRFLDQLLFLKKTSGARKKVLIVLDEAQEFIPDRTSKADFTEDSNRAVEALLRQGRKYRAHCWVSTQRVAHLNVNALQQLHSYFVSTLPRFYDRMVIADAFSLSYDILERTTELETGEWLFVSYKATQQKNVPAFIRAPDNEEAVAEALTGM